MIINKPTNINFRANYYTVKKTGKYYEISKISTDNKENIGKEPVLEYKSQVKKYEFPMTYDGKFYTTPVYPATDNYRILYKDTGKYERNGEWQKINPLFYTKIAMREDFKRNGLPLEYAISKGETKGKVFVNTLDIPKDIQAVLVFDYVKNEEDLLVEIPDNVKCVIVSSGDIGVLSHCANLSRNRFEVFSVILDENKYNNLKKYKDKYISIKNENGIVDYKEIGVNDITTQNPNSVFSPTIAPPKLENVERLLNFDELTPQNCGNKGYRLGVMQKLVKDGILKDINIPKGFVIPEGYIKKYNEYLDVEDEEEWKRRINDGIYYHDTENKIKELGLPRDSLIIRSNFNTEDLGSFSSAGIYISEDAGSSSIIDYAAFDVAEGSLAYDENPIAEKVHKKYGIEDKDIQPSVIIQDKIHSDYEYTVYSDDGDNNIIIDLSDFRFGHMKPTNALIKYNKETKVLTLERKQSPFATYLFDEKGNIIDQEHPTDSITENWNILTPLLSIVASGALVLEKYFKHPQDIEGGFGKDGKVYFWQTRDIVAKAVKRI